MEHDDADQPKRLWTPPQPNQASVEVLRRDINRKHGLNLGMEVDRLGYAVSGISPKVCSKLPRPAQVLCGKLHLLARPMGSLGSDFVRATQSSEFLVSLTST